jgi:hypothetical protein
MCDFCGSFTDIDFSVGMDTWNESAGTTINYQLRKMDLITRAQNALVRGDRQQYYDLQREYWDFYYRAFPAYLPPTIDTPEKYALYIEVCAESSLESGFDPKWQQYSVIQANLQSAVRYVQSEGRTVAERTSFITLADFFVRITREGMRTFYENPRYAIMHELLPESLHFKMRSSMFVQAWIPYLMAADADRLLRMTGFTAEYVEIAPPPGETVKCTCGASVFAPEGSYKVFCESCRTVLTVRPRFFCMSCGAPNQLPENPGKPVPCSRCGIANRLIRPQFGN